MSPGIALCTSAQCPEHVQPVQGCEPRRPETLRGEAKIIVRCHHQATRVATNGMSGFEQAELVAEQRGRQGVRQAILDGAHGVAFGCGALIA